MAPSPGRAEPPGRATESRPGFALVELFTSEGCSSCPPADRVLARVAERSAAEGLPVYVLSLHVDYWNQLGWRDPFSSAEASARQRRYALTLGGGVYTPQAVVNGSWQGLGSDESELWDSIEAKLREPAEAVIDLAVELADGDLVVRPSLRAPAPPSTRLRLALSEKRATQRVDEGENAGRELSHVHVVRRLEVVPVGEVVRLQLPRALAGRALSVTAFLENTRSGRVLGASRADVPPAS